MIYNTCLNRDREKDLAREEVVIGEEAACAHVYRDREKDLAREENSKAPFLHQLLLFLSLLGTTCSTCSTCGS